MNAPNVQGSSDVNSRGLGPTDRRPWCWQEKSVIRLIRDTSESKTYLDQTLAVYLVMTEKASDKQSAIFDVSKREIEAKSGVSLRRVTIILNELRALGVLDWATNRVPGSKELLPNTYSLMLGTACATLGNGSTRLGKNGASDNCAVIEEFLEESSEKSLLTHSKERRTHHSSKDDWRSHYSEGELEAIGLYNEICVPRGWRPVNTYSAQLHDAMEIWVGYTDVSELRKMFEQAADDRDNGVETYNARLGNKMIRIFWSNY
ncbi:MAG TPA: hypothetical protein VNW72_04285 [Chthoniobacterales bacterium]|jgi:hypothetical protein|nr:hypothetical protein [Chthoniobacterales bacterium]